MERSRLSSWTAMKDKFKTKRNKLERQVNQLLADIGSLDKKIRVLEGKIENLNNQELRISEHAFNRYRERFNPEATDEEIMEDLITEELKIMTSTLGNGKYPWKLTHSVVVKDKVILTIY